MKTIASAIVALGFLIPTVLLSQWQQTNGPYGGPVNSLTIDGTILFAGTNVGVYRSTNNGALWTDARLTNTAVNALFVNGTSVFAGTPIGVYRSTDHGLSWTVVNTGLTDLHVNAIAARAGLLYAGTDGGMFKSTNGGTSWLSAGALPMPVISIEVTSDVTGATLVYAGCSTKSQSASGLFLSTDQGTTWTKLGVPSDQNFIEFDGELSAVRDSLYAGAKTKYGYNQADNGQRIFACNPKVNPRDWALSPIEGMAFELQPPTGMGRPPVFVSVPKPVGIVRYGWSNNSTKYVQNKETGYVFRYVGHRDSGGSLSFFPPKPWLTLRPQPEGNRPIVVESGADVFSASASGSIWISKRQGLPFSQNDSYACAKIDQGMLNSEPYALALLPDTGGKKRITAVTRLNGDYMFQSADRGVTWSVSAAGPGSAVSALGSAPATGGAATAFASTANGLYKSTDGGSNWGKVRVDPNTDPGMVGLAVLGGNVLAASSSTVYRSSDSGLNWKSIRFGLQLNAIGTGPVTSEGTSVIVGTSSGLYRSKDLGTSWVKVGSPTPGNEPIIAFATNGSALFAIVSGLGVYRSYDNGVTWNQASGGLHIGELTSLTACGGQLFAANDGDGVFVSSNDGETWTAINTGLTSLKALSLASDSSELYVGTVSGVFRYTGSLASVASMTLTVPDTVAESTSFWVEVKVGTPNPVKDLKGIAFLLTSNNPSCQYVDSTAAYGPFMVKETIQGFRLHPSEHYSRPDAQTVSIALGGWAETSGSGVVAKAQFRSSGLVSSRDVTFSLVNVRAWDPSGNTIALGPGSVRTHIAPAGAEVWPGDCNNSGVVDAADILPVGIYYGQTLGMQNKPGIAWQGFLREGWPGDTLRKKIHADANGDGFINSVDVLAVGLNYGKTHQVVGAPGSVGLARSVADGLIQIGPYKKSQRSGELLTLPVSLKSTASVYGVAFKMKYGLIGSANSGSVRLLRIDTAGTVFGGGLMLNRISEEDGVADVGITRVHGNGFAGQDVLMNLVFDAPSNSPVWVETSNVAGNDEKGNALRLMGSVFRSDAEGANETSSVPTENALMQNYPNPFNPATTINFQLSDVSAVSLKVFDILGREIVTLVNEEKPAGSFIVRWDATGVPSGIYCFQMTARNKSGQMFTQTRRMTIVK